MDTNSPIKATATLIDASEKPLRRSPTGASEYEEDWPILCPQRAASPGTLQEMMRETGSQLKQQSMPPNNERYPKLGDITREVSIEQPLVSRFSAHYKMHRPENSEYITQTASATNADITNIFQDSEHVSDRIHEHHEKSIPPSQLSAGAAAVEKSASQSLIEPSQTRTSSLRARLSAGSIIKEANSKVAGFTDFTARPEPSAGSNHWESLRMRREAQANSPAPPAPQSLRTRASQESMKGNRAPAKFVAGSRRPIPPRRSGSRGSHRSELRPPSPSAPSRPSNRSAPSARPLKDGSAKDAKHSEISLRHTSVPVPRSTPLVSQVHAEASNLDRQKSTSDDIATKMPSPTNFSIFEDDPESSIETDHGQTAVTDKIGENGKVKTFNDKKRTSGLEAIDESPRHAYQFKRLSSKSPEFGPTLSISPSAERYIMGVDDNKENRPLNKNKDTDLKQTSNVGFRGPHVNGKISSATNTRLERPLSSHGVPQASSRTGLVDPKVREKKARSADLSSMIENQTEILKAKPLSKNPSNATTVSTANDPFFDASEEPQGDVAAVPRGDKIPVSVAQNADHILSLPKASKPGENNPASTTAASSENGQGVGPKTPIEYDPFKYDTAADKRTPHEDLKGKQNVKVWPLTPAQTPPANDTSSSRHPPRSSSRQEKPDFTAVVATSSKTFSEKPTVKAKEPSVPPKEFVRRQNNLGSARGHGSSQLDLAASTTKRDSAARESFKSQTSLPHSLSKSRFNLKTLFHKRSSERNEPVKSSKKSKSKVTINNNGSPFPPISEIHPVHRPTLASTNRPSGPTPRPSTSVSARRPLTPATPALASPTPNEVSRTTTLAMSLLESARKETSSPKKENLLELGKIVVDAITQARDAERAAEEAKLAFKRAEKASEMCKRAVGEVGRLVEAVKAV